MERKREREIKKGNKKGFSQKDEKKN